METKKCNKCGLEKPVEEFCKSSSMIDGLQLYCKACQKQGVIARKAKSKDVVSFDDYDYSNVPARHIEEVNELREVHSNILIYALRARGYSGDLEFKMKVKI